MDREVFTPAGMEQTVPDLGDEAGETVKYDRAAFGTLRRSQDIDMSCPMAAGGFLRGNAASGMLPRVAARRAIALSVSRRRLASKASSER
jgi:hypothetical protein